MPNPLFNQYGSQPNDVNNIIREAQNFRNSFRGNAREEVQKLLNSGQMSQSDFNRLMPIAQQIAAMMPKR
jgi:hypothetical protein